MSSAKYTAKLTADTSQHDRALGKSKQQVYNYQKGVEKSKKELQQFTSSIKNGAVGALTTFGSVIGVGVGAIETFNKIVKSSQTTSDAWDGVIRGCTNSVNTFFTALATGDFTSFNQGLDVLIAKGKKAQQALDQLGNTQISYGYFNSKNRAEFASALTTAKDKSKSKAERDLAIDEAKEILQRQETNVTALTTELTNALSALGTESNRLSTMTVERFEKVLSYDLLPEDLRKQVKERLEAEYKIYQEELAKMDKAVNRKQTYTGYVSATGQKTVLYDMKLKELNEKYVEAIDYKTWLVNKDDEQLVNATNLLTKIQDTNRSLEEMKRQLLEITNQTASLVNETKKVSFQPKELQMAGISVNTASSDLPDMINLNVPMYDAYGAKIKEQTENLQKMQEQANLTATAVGALGNAFIAMAGNTDDASSKALAITGTLANGLAQIIPQIIALKQGQSLANGVASASEVEPLPAKIVAIGSIMASIIGTFSQIRNITKGYANGGIIGGSNTLGDLNIARVNKGEMILNGSQQGRLFKLLNSNVSVANSSLGSGEIKLRVSGTDLVAVLNSNNNKMRRVI